MGATVNMKRSKRQLSLPVGCCLRSRQNFTTLAPASSAFWVHEIHKWHIGEQGQLDVKLKAFEGIQG